MHDLMQGPRKILTFISQTPELLHVYLFPTIKMYADSSDTFLHADDDTTIGGTSPSSCVTKVFGESADGISYNIYTVYSASNDFLDCTDVTFTYTFDDSFSGGDYSLALSYPKDVQDTKQPNLDTVASIQIKEADGSTRSVAWDFSTPGYDGHGPVSSSEHGWLYVGNFTFGTSSTITLSGTQTNKWIIADVFKLYTWSPSLSSSQTPSNSRTSSVTPFYSITPSQTASETGSSSETASQTASTSETPSESASQSMSETPSESASQTSTALPSASHALSCGDRTVLLRSLWMLGMVDKSESEQPSSIKGQLDICVATKTWLQTSDDV